MTAITVNLNFIIQLTDNQFYQLCRENPEVKFERNAEGKLLIMPPTGGEAGNRNSEISADFVIWNRQTKLGICFDSSTCFKLPNGANRSPDVAWIRKERWNALTPEEQEKFPPIAPDFVLELMSPSDITIATKRLGCFVIALPQFESNNKYHDQKSSLTSLRWQTVIVEFVETFSHPGDRCPN